MSKIKGIDPTLELGPGGWPNVVETRPSAKSPVDPYVNNKNPAAAAAGELALENTRPAKQDLHRGKYLAIVLKVNEDYNFPHDTHPEAQRAALFGLSPEKVFSVTAYINTVDCLPFPESGDDIHLIQMREHTFEFIGSMDGPRKPEKNELIWVNYGYQGAGIDWTDGVYLGPKNNANPAKVNIISREAAADAIANASGGDGTLPQTASPPDWTRFLKERKNKGFLSTMTPSRHEIYIDKTSDYFNLERRSIVPNTEYGTLTHVDAEHHKTNPAYRPDRKIYVLPPHKKLQQRKQTRMLILRESGTSRFEPYYDLDEDPLMHYNVVYKNLVKEQPSRKKTCAIVVNIPYGLTFEDIKGPFSKNAVGCVLSSPGDGKAFFKKAGVAWDPRLRPHILEGLTQFSEFKSEINNWVSSKKLPDGAPAYIMGPYGTPGLETGPNEGVANNFWEGRLTWARWGHYFLPDERQVILLYNLVSSLVRTPPQSVYSWGFKPARTSDYLNFDFPALKTKRGDPDFGFHWGTVSGEYSGRGRITPKKWWQNCLTSKNVGKKQKVSGISAAARWIGKGTDGLFLEYYILTRSLGFKHNEAWYITLAVASETFPKKYGGVGFGPSPIPTDALLNKYLKKGQRMWYRAATYMHGDKSKELSSVAKKKASQKKKIDRKDR